MCDLVTMCVVEISKGFKIADVKSPLVDGPISSAFTHLHQSVVFEDSATCLDIATNPKQFHHLMKDIGIKLHHFHYQVAAGHVIVKKVDTATTIKTS